MTLNKNTITGPLHCKESRQEFNKLQKKPAQDEETQRKDRHDDMTAKPRTNTGPLHCKENQQMTTKL